MSLLRSACVAGAAIAGAALGMTLLNMATWPRGSARARAPRGARVSILIPARDEQAHIEACVRAALSSSHPLAEVLVYDDHSRDATPEILARLALKEPRLRVLRGEALPPGWVGKPHACHQLARAARGDLLLFVDADTCLKRDGLARIVSVFQDFQADLVTAAPRQVTGSWAERLILPLLHLTYTSWFPLVLTWKSSDARFLAANGQLLGIKREVYEEVGGFEAVRRELVDDMAICRRVKRAGHRVVFADGHEMATCRMYGDARQVWEGFSKNIYEGIGAHPAALLAVTALYGAGFILPYLGLAASRRRRELLAPSAAGVAANVALRAALAARFGHAREGILLHPVAVAGLLAIAVNSAHWHRRGAIQWSGRAYAPDKTRGRS